MEKTLLYKVYYYSILYYLLINLFIVLSGGFSKWKALYGNDDKLVTKRSDYLE